MSSKIASEELEELMGFWAGTGKVLVAAGKLGKDFMVSFAETANEQTNELREYKQKFEKLTDKQLIEELQKTGMLGNNRKERGVIYGILKKRGYTQSDINERIGE